jgi:hypothetical protein
MIPSWSATSSSVKKSADMVDRPVIGRQFPAQDESLGRIIIAEHICTFCNERFPDTVITSFGFP